MIKRKEIVFVKWQDATTFVNSWSDEDEVKQSQPQINYVVGILAESNKETIKIALMSSKGGRWSDWIVIPQGDVLKREHIDYIQVEVDDDN